MYSLWLYSGTSLGGTTWGTLEGYPGQVFSISTYSLMQFGQHILARFGCQALKIWAAQGSFEQLPVDQGESSLLDLYLVGHIPFIREFSRVDVVYYGVHP